MPMSTGKAGDQLGLTADNVRLLCEQGEFRDAFKTKGGHWRIPEASVDDFRVAAPQGDALEPPPAFEVVQAFDTIKRAVLATIEGN